MAYAHALETLNNKILLTNKTGKSIYRRKRLSVVVFVLQIMLRLYIAPSPYSRETRRHEPNTGNYSYRRRVLLIVSLDDLLAKYKLARTSTAPII